MLRPFSALIIAVNLTTMNSITKLNLFSTKHLLGYKYLTWQILSKNNVTKVTIKVNHFQNNNETSLRKMNRFKKNPLVFKF